MGMIELSFISMLLKLCYGAFAFIGIRMILWYFDKMSGFKFKEWITDDTTSDVAIGIYLAGRIVAICLLIGYVLA